MNDRAVSTTVGYVIGLGVMALLISTLLFSAGSFVSDQREQAVRAELKVVGQQVSNQLSRTDRMVEAGTDTANVSIRSQTPGDVAGSNYYIKLKTSTSNPHLVLSANDPDVRVRVNVTTETALEASTVDGGAYRIVYNESIDRLVMRNA